MVKTPYQGTEYRGRILIKRPLGSISRASTRDHVTQTGLVLKRFGIKCTGALGVCYAVVQEAFHVDASSYLRSYRTS